MSDDARRPHDAATAAHRAFAETSDPAAYVPRPACERVLERLATWAAPGSAGPTVAVLVGSPGLGKTLLLRTLQKRVEGGVLYLPYAGLGPVDLAHWVYGLFGRTRTRALDALAEVARADSVGASDAGAAGGVPTTNDAGAAGGAGAAGDAGSAEGAGATAAREDAATAAIEALKALGGSAGPFFLFIDDADSMPPETIHALATRLPGIDSPLRLLLAVNPDARGSRLLAAFHAFVPLEVVFRERMTVEETGEYVRARMRWAGFAEAEVGRIDENAARHFHALSGGVPRALHAQAWSDFDRVLAEGEWPALDAKRRREEWMGQAIRDEEEADWGDAVDWDDEADERAGAAGAAGEGLLDAPGEGQLLTARAPDDGAIESTPPRSPEASPVVARVEEEEPPESDGRGSTEDAEDRAAASGEPEDEDVAAARRARRRRRRRR